MTCDRVLSQPQKNMKVNQQSRTPRSALLASCPIRSLLKYVLSLLLLTAPDELNMRMPQKLGHWLINPS